MSKNFYLLKICGLCTNIILHCPLLIEECFLNSSQCFFLIKVKRWITINEPFVVSNLGYGTGEHAPGVTGQGVNDYKAAHNLLNAHASVYGLYKQKYRSQKGNKFF